MFISVGEKLFPVSILCLRQTTKVWDENNIFLIFSKFRYDPVFMLVFLKFKTAFEFCLKIDQSYGSGGKYLPEAFRPSPFIFNRPQTQTGRKLE